MARLNYIHCSFYEASVNPSSQLLWTQKKHQKPVERLPQIYWNDHSGWTEANLWAGERAASGTVTIDTIERTMKHLARYASFTESERVDWRHFPVRQSEQVLRKFRKHLIEERDAGMIMPSTASNCMNAVIQFYRFVTLHNLVGNSTPMWNDRLAVIPFYDGAGFKRAMLRLSSDLSIPNRATVGVRLEDGLLPLRAEHMSELLAHTAEQAIIELHLMLSSGFFSGARLGTITTMTVSSLQTAKEDPATPGVFLFPVGPGTGVATKFSVKGDLMMPKEVLDDLKRYAFSTRRLLREAKAQTNHKDILFLSRRGRPYSVGSVNRLVQDLRRRTVEAGMHFMANFRFHQSRATFGTWLTKLLIDSGLGITDALGIVMDAMLHKDEATTMRYVRFLRNSKAKQDAAAAFNTAFTGLKNRDWNKEAA